MVKKLAQWYLATVWDSSVYALNYNNIQILPTTMHMYTLTYMCIIIQI